MLPGDVVQTDNQASTHPLFREVKGTVVSIDHHGHATVALEDGLVINFDTSYLTVINPPVSPTASATDMKEPSCQNSQAVSEPALPSTS